MFEIELKFPIEDHETLIEKITHEGAVFVSEDRNEDTYYNHPCRDFATTGEALRIRREGDHPLVTYKAPKVAASNSDSSGQVKAREELEWRLDPGDQDGTSMERLLTHLSFRKVATVVKNRKTFRLGASDDAMTITVDQVDDVGNYAEIECVLPTNEPTDEQITEARNRVQSLADRLGLTLPESRSYLRMLLEHPPFTAPSSK